MAKSKKSVKCVNVGLSGGLTLGKVYDVEKSAKDFYDIKNDSGEIVKYDSLLFVANGENDSKPDTTNKPENSAPAKPVQVPPDTIPNASKLVEVLDPKDLSKRLEIATKTINKQLDGITKSFCKIGYELYKVREEKLYIGQDFRNVSEYGEKVLGFQKSSVSNYISICERFSVEKNGKPTAQLKPEFSSFSYSQLSIMLALPEEKIPEISPALTCSEIRDIKKQEKVKKEFKASGSGKKSNKAANVVSGSGTSPAPAPASAPALNMLTYKVAWSYKGELVKNAIIRIDKESDDNIHKDIGVLLKNDWFDFGRDGDSLTIALVGGNDGGDSK